MAELKLYLTTYELCVSLVGGEHSLWLLQGGHI